ncbi:MULTISPECIES: hypothetical protein [unclassified Treponema]|uniref:hypothetical protein n=1 Tax=unclassified Treponema TaxID=2638727 RepID=UPI0025D7EB14|nr:MULTISPECIES: hypothetical protein [unclassified Treponema]
MKKFLKALAVLAAVAALGFGFASCSDSDDDDGGSGSAPSLAAYSGTNSDGETETITFYSDNTYAMHIYSKETDDGMTVTMDLDVEKGTYTGDPTKDGTVVCTSVSQVNRATMVELMMKAMYSGSNSLTITNSNCPLEALDSSKVKTRKCTISGTTLTDDEDNKYTRK